MQVSGGSIGEGQCEELGESGTWFQWETGLGPTFLGALGYQVSCRICSPLGSGANLVNLRSITACGLPGKRGECPSGELGLPGHRHSPGRAGEGKLRGSGCNTHGRQEMGPLVGDRGSVTGCHSSHRVSNDFFIQIPSSRETCYRSRWVTSVNHFAWQRALCCIACQLSAIVAAVCSWEGGVPRLRGAGNLAGEAQKP